MSKRTLITGASRGIGRAIAEKLAAPDVTLLLHGRDTVALAETCKAIQSRCAGVVVARAWGLRAHLHQALIDVMP